MNIERKSYPVANLKADDQTGIIEAIVSVFNNVDHGKEIVRPGFFQKSIDRKLPKGVWAHDWKQPIAKTLEAKELYAGDPLLPAHLMSLGGAYIKGQFNLDTQRGRESYSDIKFGIVDEFSIGYAVLKDGKDQETGARELIEGDWKEWSPVLVGMNDQTALISIKSEEPPANESKTIRKCKPEDMEEGKPWCLYSEDGDTLLGRHATRQECVEQEEAIETNKPKGKGMLAEEMAQTTPSTWEVESALRRVIRKIAETAKDSDVTGVVMDWKAKVTEAINEYPPTMTPIVIAQIEEFLESSDDEFYLKGESVSGSFESFDAVVSAVKKHHNNMQRNHEARVKEGRVLSSSNRATVQKCKDALMELMGDLDALLEMSEPKPKEKEIELDLDALRAQSARLRNHALRTLSRIA